MTFGLTSHQQKLYEFIKDREQRGLPPPSCREMCDAMGWVSKSNVCRVLDELEERGYVRRLPHRKRSVHTVPAGDPSERLRSNLLNRLENCGSSLLTVEFVRTMVRTMPA